MKLFGKILASLRRLFASLIWFAAAPKDWDPELEYEIGMGEEGYLALTSKYEIKQ